MIKNKKTFDDFKMIVNEIYWIRRSFLIMNTREGRCKENLEAVIKISNVKEKFDSYPEFKKIYEGMYKSMYEDMIDALTFISKNEYLNKEYETYIKARIEEIEALMIFDKLLDEY